MSDFRFNKNRNMLKNKKFNKGGQVWVETVVYTLIGLVLISLVLAFATPAIQKQKDKALIEKTISAMTELDSAILSVKRTGTANTQPVDFLITEGTLKIDGLGNKTIFTLENIKSPYSEVGRTVDVGSNMKVKTTENRKNYDVVITLDYTGAVDLKYGYETNDVGTVINTGEQSSSFVKAQTPYRFIVENLGKDAPATPGDPVNPVKINIYEISG